MHKLSTKYGFARRIVVAVIGGTMLLLGMIMLVAPGPGIPVIIAGLGILALEFYWARRWLEHLRQQMRRFGVHVPGREPQDTNRPN